MLDELLSRAAAELESAGIVGPHGSHPRRANIAKIRALVDGEEADASFGLSGVRSFDASEVLGLVAEVTGCSADIEDLESIDGIDPGRAVAALAEGARRLAQHASRGDMLLAATGHPTGVLELHIRVVDAYRRAGGKVLRLREDEKLPFGRGRAEVRYVGGVGCLADGASLRHTHSSEAMEAVLESEPRPDIVLGDHGFAGAAIERGIPTVAVMDTNDPALAVVSGRGADVTVVPMDDNRPLGSYVPALEVLTGKPR